MCRYLDESLVAKLTLQMVFHYAYFQGNKFKNHGKNVQFQRIGALEQAGMHRVAQGQGEDSPAPRPRETGPHPYCLQAQRILLNKDEKMAYTQAYTNQSES